MTHHRELFACLILGTLLSTAPAHAAKHRIAIPDFAVERGMDESLVRLLNEMVLTEFGRSGLFDVIGGSDLRAMLELNEQKDLMGCEDDSCLAEIGNALGVELLGVMRVGKIGSRYFINLKLLNVRRAKVEVRWSEAVPANEDALMDGVARSIQKVLESWRRETGAAQARAQATSEGSASPQASAADAAKDADAPQVATLEPTPGTLEGTPGLSRSAPTALPTWAPWAAAGVGAVGVAATVFFGLKTRSEASARDSAPDQASYASHDDSARQAALLTNISGGVGSLALAAATGLWLWNRLGSAASPNEPAAQKNVWLLAPTDAGVQVGLQIPWSF